MAHVRSVGWVASSVFMDASRWGLILVPPLVARLHQHAPQAREICFADASSSLTNSNDRVICIYTNAIGAAVPLGYLVLNAFDSELVTATLQEWSNLQIGRAHV